MARNSLRQWSTTAASNTDIAGISLAEGVTKPSDVNDFERAHMGQMAQYLAEMSYPTVGGSADVLTLTPTTALAALANNTVYSGTIAATNATTTPTLNVSALGAKVIRKMSGGIDIAIGVGDLPANWPARFLYSTAANSSGGAWIIINPASGSTATAANYQANSGTLPIGVDQAWAAMAEVTLTDAATIAWDMSTGMDFTVTLSANRVLGNPSNSIIGKRGRIRVVQDSTGGRTLTKSSNCKTIGGSAITLSTAANAIDYLDYDCVSATNIRLALSRAWS